MTDFDRNWTEARRAQGFKSPADLDAFLAYYDHTCACVECQKPGKSVAVDDGYQHTMNRCEHAKAMFAAWCDIHDSV